jgi:hypothetical protein
MFVMDEGKAHRSGLGFADAHRVRSKMSGAGDPEDRVACVILSHGPAPRCGRLGGVNIMKFNANSKRYSRTDEDRLWLTATTKVHFPPIEGVTLHTTCVHGEIGLTLDSHWLLFGRARCVV